VYNLINSFGGDFMDKGTQLLIIITAACLILSACGGKLPAVTPAVNEKSTSPTVGSTPEQKPVNPTIDKVARISPTAGVPQANPLVITRDMNGKSFSLQAGDTFEIQLSTIPMAGFEWTPQDLDTTILIQQGQPVYTAGTSPNSAGGIVTLKFKAIGAGTTHLTLLYLRPAENGVPALYNNSFAVNIAVK
jgi:predicted secreted protein